MLRYLAAGALMMAAVVSAEPVVVEVGGFVTLQRTTADQWTVVDKGRASQAPESALEERALAELVGAPPPKQEVPAVLLGGDAGAKPPMKSDVVRFVLRAVPGHRDVMLVVENGYQQYLRYSAMLDLGDGTWRPTTVCVVMDGKRPSFEHWPGGLSRIRLDELALISTPNTIECS